MNKEDWKEGLTEEQINESIKIGRDEGVRAIKHNIKKDIENMTLEELRYLYSIVQSIRDAHSMFVTLQLRALEYEQGDIFGDDLFGDKGK